MSQLQNITSHPHLLTVHDFEQEGSEELDTIILKALIKGEGAGAGVSWGASCAGLLPAPAPSWASPSGI